MTLLDHLNAIYSRQHGQADGDPVAAFVAALKVDPALKAQAEATRAAITPNVEKRDYVTKIRRQALDECLAQA